MQYRDYMDYTSVQTILDHPDPFGMEPEKARELRFAALRASFLHHFENNVPYRAFCEDEAVSPDMISGPKDLGLIPLIPADFFRDVSASEGAVDSIASVPRELIARYFTTSGTGGLPSLYPYDGRSLQTINRSNVIIFEQVGQIDPDDYVLFLTPSPEEADTGMVQGMYLTLKSMLSNPGTQIAFAMKENRLDSTTVLAMLQQEKRTRHLYGPPYAYNQIADEFAAKDVALQLDPDSKAYTTGGWKSHRVGQITADDLRAKIGEAFGITGENIRDGLGLTDIMSILLECEHGQKHVPPWIDVSIRSLDDPSWRTAVGPREDGLIAFLDPLIGSFPAYIITGDVGKLLLDYEERCDCGRYGPTVAYVRRAGDPRGCALRQEQLMTKVKESKAQ